MINAQSSPFGTLELDTQQAKILGAGHKLVIACPGSGKTRAIVARFMTRDTNEPRGKALLSFTNRAIDEAKLRCRVEPSLLLPPNFIGTFDAFIHKFIVTPWYAREIGVAPVYLDSYRDLRLLNSRIRTKPGEGIGLWNFRMVEGKRAELIESSLSSDEKYYIREVGLKTSKWEEIAYKQIRRLILKEGIIDCESARYVAATVLKSESGSQISESLGHRFSEVIVDEAQDCDLSEINILKILSNSGVMLVVVADPDQSIYGFRGADVEHFRDYAASFEDADKLVMSNNYRSTPAICRLIESMSTTGAIESFSVGHPTREDIIYILRGNPEMKRAKFMALCSDYGIAPASSIVLAPTWSVAHRLSGVVRTRSSDRFSDRIVLSIDAAANLGFTLSERNRSLDNLDMQLIQEIFDWSQIPTRFNFIIMLGHLEINREWLKFVRAGLIAIVMNSQTREECGNAMRSYLIDRLGGLRIPIRNLSDLVAAPSQSVWDSHTNSMADSVALMCSSVHSAKGGEWEAVWFEMATDQYSAAGLQAWENRSIHEKLRILYVGASRAKKLLVLSQSNWLGGDVGEIMKGKSLDFITI